jgi:hypothetical protein
MAVNIRPPQDYQTGTTYPNAPQSVEMVVWIEVPNATTDFEEGTLHQFPSLVGKDQNGLPRLVETAVFPSVNGSVRSAPPKTPYTDG